ncbi:hypothetical protein QF046_002233 [Microbacterium sp. W4I4]|uniref:hypothetical protein n=1 Tax=Microbacterium sp. W4I4 TaxID=3042295 RepID=UPI002786FCFC|nr:hypothetical protein [Microbacterium sp. W4I4]MDQ0614592.1 hypothetical protein [Microbacterium sp. W4I4]
MTAPTSPRPRTWTASTIVLLIVCILVASAAVTAAALLPGYLRDGPRREAESTLRAFLDDATASDADWQDTASTQLQALVPMGAPLLGERITADALKLSARYEIGELSFSRDDLRRSDVASAIVVVHYRYTILGETGRASVTQKVWLTRPFYYGDDQPQQADATESPSAVGPWRVAGLSVPSSEDGKAPASEFDLASEERPSDTLACYAPVSALVQVADNARIDGVFASSCFLGEDDGSDVLGDGVDPAALLEAFPAITDGDPASLPPELIRVDADIMHAMRPPFTQYLIGDRYVVTFAAVSTGPGHDAVRLVSIQDAEAEDE